MAKDPTAITVNRFSLTIDGKDLGLFTRCSGLALSVEVDEVVEGGINESPVHLNTRIRYAPLVVTRPVAAATMDLCQWVQESVRRPDRLTGQISCLGTNGEEVAKWELRDVVPVAWRGPTLDAGSAGIATEEIEFVHGGFFRQGGA
ncbi:phage tail protein [Streptomyces sp. x-19]|uniref:phage tail protein n=1 Tax=Streptomyces sp. x-19 TaxID=2789280 RepID=UPI003980F306